jgi:exonuclease III
MTLKVMEFNIEYGGTQVSFRKVVAAIKAADPDIVGVEEAETNTARLAKEAGYPYYNASMQIVSKYPILEPSGSQGAYAFIVVQPGKAVTLSNVHLPSAPYGPYYAKLGKPAAKIIALEQRVRVPAVAKQLELLPGPVGAGIPAFVVGDFNSPSHLDWVEATVGSRFQIKEPVEWPVSKAMADAGFRDSWREVHPDPVENPGLTWWAARPKVSDWNPGPKNPQDRIDFIYAAGPAKATASVIVGEKGGPEVSIPISPWPSDHRAVVSTFEVTPGALPDMVAVDTWLVTVGNELKVTFHAPGKSGEKIVIVTEGGDPAAGVTSAPTGPAGTTDGTLSFATTGWSPGGYEAVLVGADGAPVARVPFWVQAKGAKVELATDKTTYKPGEPIVVTWKNAPANRWDWLGVYKAAAADPNVDWYLIWQYTGGAMSGSVHGMPAGSFTFAETGHAGSPWPLPPGKYVVYYLLADGYESVAQANFTVAK